MGQQARPCRAQRPKAAKLVIQPRLRAVAQAKLALRWSPSRLLAGRLPLANPQDSVMRVSDETIYLSLFIQSRRALVPGAATPADGAGDALTA